MDEDLPDRKKYIIKREDVDLLPASIQLSDIEIKLVSAMSREYILRTIIDEIQEDYEFALLDAMPSLGLMTLNVLASCDGVLIGVYLKNSKEHKASFDEYIITLRDIHNYEGDHFYLRGYLDCVRLLLRLNMLE